MQEFDAWKEKLMYKAGESQLFKGPDTLAAARYHSLAALKDTLPVELRVTAESEDVERSWQWNIRNILCSEYNFILNL